ncbi:helix-turn-helix domain-containing protein [Halomarina oriensis]|uniref:Bacterio-opsin activator n=1 Tax=Halomarina oriensis TaxID=671145 RepID=A0A6B0GDC8_9EURY|nr:helix-turn-helix domain-containing protein [Halomarina oriensis]MWG32916.1 bacterio-opsin activator [Halomarina oriensis]
MIVIADVSVPASQFPLGRVLDGFPDVELELERIVPLREAVIPLFWVRDGDTEAVEETLRADPVTNSVTRLTTTGARVLYQIEWSPEVNGLVQSLLSSDAKLLAAAGTAGVWDFRIQFQTRADLGRFRESCEEAGISLTLRRLYNPTLPERSGNLSTEQYEALVAAYRAGYFEVPRGSKMGDLAAEFDVSDSAFSQRIRRGISSFIAETLMPEFGRTGGRTGPVSWDTDRDTQ